MAGKLIGHHPDIGETTQGTSRHDHPIQNGNKSFHQKNEVNVFYDILPFSGRDNMMSDQAGVPHCVNAMGAGLSNLRSGSGAKGGAERQNHQSSIGLRSRGGGRQDDEGIEGCGLLPRVSDAHRATLHSPGCSAGARGRTFPNIPPHPAYRDPGTTAGPFVRTGRPAGEARHVGPLRIVTHAPTVGRSPHPVVPIVILWSGFTDHGMMASWVLSNS